MDTATQITSEERNSQSVPGQRDKELRALWAQSTCIPSIAIAMGVEPSHVRVMAMRLGLKRRSRLSLRD